jgi:phytoene synthase
LLSGQVRALRHLVPPVLFAAYPELNAFIHAFVVPHARLLARLAGADRNWQQPQIQALAEGFFLVRTLTALPADLARNRLFIPEEDCDRAGVGFEQLRRGMVDDRVKKLLWKQSVRARDAFAQSLPLAGELERRYARAFKRWWLGGLEVLNEVERRDYDVWTSPVTLKPRHRMLVRFQARFGRATFRK